MKNWRQKAQWNVHRHTHIHRVTYTDACKRMRIIKAKQMRHSCWAGEEVSRGRLLKGGGDSAESWQAGGSTAFVLHTAFAAFACYRSREREREIAGCCSLRELGAVNEEQSVRECVCARSLWSRMCVAASAAVGQTVAEAAAARETSPQVSK